VVGEHLVPNSRFEKVMETSDQWIRERSGIEQRYFVADGVATSDLGVRAAKVAMEQAVALPFATRHLADLGAEVIKVERPQGGDQARGVRSIKSLEIGDWNQYFLVINRNKKSMAVDLKKPGGKEIRA